MNLVAQLLLTVIDAARILVGAAFVLGLVVAATHALVRSQRIAAFGGWASFVRRWSDPLLKPIERRLHGAGGNPQHAPWWLVAGVVVLGLVLISLLKWLVGFVLTLGYAVAGGPRAIAFTTINTIISLLMLLLLVRVFGSWFGAGRYNRWMKIPYAATDWLVEPIRQRLPPFGMFDVSPLVAYLVLMLLRILAGRAIL